MTTNEPMVLLEDASYRIRLRLRSRRRPSMTMAAVLENEDLLWWILQKANLSPHDFVAATRVSKVWRDVCFRDGQLAMQAARQAHCLTKRALMGLLALSSEEADRLPRGTRKRPGGGLMYSYPVGVVNLAWEGVVGGTEAGRARLCNRSRELSEIEVAFGANWQALMCL